MNNKIEFWHSQSYNKSFQELLDNLKIKYGQEIFDLSGIGEQLDINYMSKKLFKNKETVANVSVDSNANVHDRSTISHKIEIQKPIQLVNSYYRLWKNLYKNIGKEYADYIVESNITGRLYINDFTGFSSSQPYCFNSSTYDTALMGIPSVFDGRGGSKPPKHLLSFFGQIDYFALLLGNTVLGATGLADLLIVVSVYMDKVLKLKSDSKVNFVSDDDCWRYLESLLTVFVHRLNQSYRGSQSLFSNVSIYDKNFIEKLIPTYELNIDDENYSAKVDIVQEVQRVYLKIMNNEMSRKPITFPITTACFSKDDNDNILDIDFLDEIASFNLKFGFINIYSGKTSTLSSCCRLRSDSDNEYFNSFGSGSSKIGSIGVVTGNLPRLANTVVNSYSKNEHKQVFLSLLKKLVEDCQNINNAKRMIILKTIESDYHPMYSLGYMDIKRQYSTFGEVGLYEALDILGFNIKTKEGQDFGIKITNVINSTNDFLQKKFDYPHNCEQIPAENVASKLAAKDTILHHNDEKYKIYSNQFIPLTKKVSILDRIKIQGLFDKHFTGGAIAHLNIDQEIKDKEVMKNLIISCVKQGVVYFAVNYILQECEKNHFSVGNVDFCPLCGSKIIDRYTRVVGFLAKIDNFTKERKEHDFPNRQFYNSTELG